MAECQWVIFVIANELFACPVAMVQEVIPYAEPVPVPGGPREISGVLNVRGDIIPVVRTADLLNTQSEQAKRIIILDKGEGLTGMEVDRVDEIIECMACSDNVVSFSVLSKSCETLLQR